MARDGHRTRTEIMDAAEAQILEKGFAGTTVESVIEDAGVTKGAFFYHFDTKADLAHALVERYARMERELTEELLADARSRTDDPARRLVLFIRLFEERMDELIDPYPGCLFASFCYERGLFDDHTLAVVEDGFERWRELIGEEIRRAFEARPPRGETDPEELADAMMVAFEGSFILSKTLDEPRLVARQLGLFRQHVELLLGVEA
jgi:TetR/AcrR family transcriptional repressor of nem operon